MNKAAPQYIRTRSFRVDSGMGLDESHYVMAELQPDGRFDIASYVEFSTGRDRVVEKQGLDAAAAIQFLYEWEEEMRAAQYPRSSIIRFRSIYFADACRQMGLSHPEELRRSEEHATKIKRAYIDKRRNPTLRAPKPMPKSNFKPGPKP